MAFKIKDGVRIGTVDVFNNAGTLLVNAPTATKVNNALTIGTGLSGTSYDGSAAVTIALSAATSSVLGGIKLGSDTQQSVAANAVTTTASRTYAIQINASGQAVVNVPWTDTDSDTTYDISAVSGGKLRLTSSGAVTDDVTFAGAGIASVSTTDANTITITATEADTLQTVTGRGASSNVATISLTGGTASTNTTSGTLVVTGGVGISGAINVGGNAGVGGDLVVTGNLTVNGTTTTINVDTVTVEDKNIVLGNVGTPTDTTADSGGITLKGTTDKSIVWLDATDSWTISEHVDLASGKAYYINGTSVLNATTLGSGVVNSSLTKVGLSTSGFVKSDASGNLSVDTATYLTSESDTLASVTGRGNTTNTGIVLQSGSTNVAVRSAVTATLATVSTTAVDTWAIATYRSAKYIVQITQGSDYQVSEILVAHNGSTTYMTEYAVIETNGALATFTSAVATGNVELRATMASATSATIRIEKVMMYI